MKTIKILLLAGTALFVSGCATTGASTDALKDVLQTAAASAIKNPCACLTMQAQYCIGQDGMEMPTVTIREGECGQCGELIEVGGGE